MMSIISRTFPSERTDFVEKEIVEAIWQKPGREIRDLISVLRLQIVEDDKRNPLLKFEPSNF